MIAWEISDPKVPLGLEGVCDANRAAWRPGAWTGLREDMQNRSGAMWVARGKIENKGTGSDGIKKETLTKEGPEKGKDLVLDM